LTKTPGPGTATRVNETAREAAQPVQQPPPDTGRAHRAGRGVLFITGSKLYFLIAGYAVQLKLPGLLGSPEAFGLYAAALSFVSILNNVMVNATIQVVSKRVSADPKRAPGTLRQALELQLGLGLSLAALLFFGAPILARSVLLDPLLTPLFRLGALIVLAYSLYSVPIGALNGQQNFLGQARFDATYTTLRTIGILGAAALGFGAVGAFAGFAGASLGVLAISLLVVGLGRSGGRTPLAGWFAFMAPLWLYQLCVSMIMQVDVMLLKRSVAALAQAGGLQLTAAADLASRYVGFYRAAQTFAFVPHQLIISVSFVVFPMVSQALSLGDESAARSYIGNALRFSLLVLLAVAAPIAGAAGGVMRLVYPSAYASGAPALAILALAMVFFALFTIGATIMTGAGRPGLAALVAVIAVSAVIAGNLGFVRLAGIGERTLPAAALGTCIGTLIALAAIGGAVYARFRTFIAPLTALRAGLAAGAAFAVATLLPGQTRLATLFALVLAGATYLLVLTLSGELTRNDFAPIVKRFGKSNS
jgi:stage V sporulation protein B